MPIRYGYDWIGQVASHILPKPLELRLNYEGSTKSNDGQGFVKTSTSNNHSFQLQPTAIGLPWNTGLQHVRQNKYWKAALQATVELLSAFTQDEIAQHIPHCDGLTVAVMAAHELEGVEDICCRFISYMYPLADEERTKLLAKMQVLILLFDGTSPQVKRSPAKRTPAFFCTQLLHLSFLSGFYAGYPHYCVRVTDFISWSTMQKDGKYMKETRYEKALIAPYQDH